MRKHVRRRTVWRADRWRQGAGAVQGLGAYRGLQCSLLLSVDEDM